MEYQIMKTINFIILGIIGGYFLARVLITLIFGI